MKTIELPNIELPDTFGGWGTIVADPPWSFDDKGSRAAPEFIEGGYSTMSDIDLLNMPVSKIAAPSSHLYLWTTDAHLSLALMLVEAWGFQYKQNLVWRKMTTNGKEHFGMGHYFRHSHELVLFGVRGKCPAAVRNLRSTFEAQARRHSEKPEELQTLAETLSPGPRLELFARRRRPGWEAWGNQLVAPEAPQSEPDGIPNVVG